jgi:hypothetical protein
MTKRSIGSKFWAFFLSIDKERIVNYLVNISFFVAFVLFIIINVIVYTHINVPEWVEKLINGTIVSVIEIGYVKVLFIAKKILDENKTKKDWQWKVKLALVIILGLGLSIPSIFSRTAFIITSVQKQKIIMDGFKKDVSQNDKNITTIDDDIDLYKIKRDDAKFHYMHAELFTNSNWTEYQVKDHYNNVMTENQTKIDKENSKRNSISTNTQAVTTNAVPSTDETYDVIAGVGIIKQIGITSGLILFTILTVIRIFFLDIIMVLFIFSGKKKGNKDDIFPLDNEKLTLKKFISDNLAQFLTYTETLFENENDKDKLVTDFNIHKKTHIPLKLCRTFKKRLTTDILVYGKPVIYTVQGATKSRYKKSEVMHVIKSYVEMY